MCFKSVFNWVLVIIVIFISPSFLLEMYEKLLDLFEKNKKCIIFLYI